MHWSKTVLANIKALFKNVPITSPVEIKLPGGFYLSVYTDGTVYIFSKYRTCISGSSDYWLYQMGKNHFSDTLKSIGKKTVESCLEKLPIRLAEEMNAIIAEHERKLLSLKRKQKALLRQAKS